MAIATERIRAAARAGAELIVLPECFGFLGESGEAKLSVCENLSNSGTLLQPIIEVAQQCGIWIIAGGWIEEAPHSKKQSYNTCVVIDPSGQCVASYRKIHLFDIDIPGKVSLQESKYTARGEEPVCVATPFGNIGLSICYDVRFPELYRKLTLQLGAEILVVPAAFTSHTGAAHWHVLLRARAIENQCYVIAPAQVGHHNSQRRSYGHSLIVSPWGEIMAECTDKKDAAPFALATLDAEELSRVRTNLPCLEHANMHRD